MHGRLLLLPAVLLHRTVVHRHVPLLPPRLVVLLGDQLGRVLGDEGVNGGEINKQAYTFLAYAGFSSLTLT